MGNRLHYISGIICTCFILVALGSGCASLEKESGESESHEQSAIADYEGMMPNELPDHINAELKAGVTIDGYLDVSKELTEYKLNKITLTRFVLEPENILEGFLTAHDNLVVKERTSSIKDDLLENGKAMEVYAAELDGGYAQCRDLYFLFSYNSEDLFNIYDRKESTQDSYLDNVPRETELDFISMEQAKKEFQDAISFFEAENLLEPEVFTFTADFLQDVADKEYEDAKNLGFEEDMERYDLDFSEEDSYYYMRMKQGVQGVPIYYLNGVDKTMTGTSLIFPTSVECVYGKNGIMELRLTSLFGIKKEEEIEIKSFYEILDNFCSTHGSVETEIKYIGLSYLPIIKDGSKLEFNGQPVWYFIYDEVSEELASRNVIIYDAETGEIIR